jgi:hypothetical protein
MQPGQWISILEQLHLSEMVGCIFLLAAPSRLWLSRKLLRGNEHQGTKCERDAHRQSFCTNMAYTLFAQICHDLAKNDLATKTELFCCAQTHNAIVLRTHH